MKLVKTIITVFVTMVCVCVCLVAVAFFFVETDYSEYELTRMIPPVFHDVKAEYIGDSYEGKEEEGYSYYRLLIEVENPCNYGMANFYFYYEGSDPDSRYGIGEIRQENDTLLYDWEREFLPAGKMINISRIVRVQNECKEFDIIYTNWDLNGEQRVHVKL